MKKILTVMLLLVIMLLFVPDNEVEAASKETKVTINKDEQIKLKTNLNKPTWGSSDSTVAKVNKKGKITGLKGGQCIVAAVKGYKAEIYSITVVDDDDMDSLAEETNAKEQEGKDVVENPAPGNTNESSTKTEEKFQLKFHTDSPKAYVDGIELVFGKTTYGEVMKALENSEYSVEKGPTLNKICGYAFEIHIMQNKKRLAEIAFWPSDSLVAKDFFVYNVIIYYNAPHEKFYYFDERFQVENMPDFMSLRESDLFSKELHWNRNGSGLPIYWDENGDIVFVEHVTQCLTGFLYDIPGEGETRYTLFIYFDSESEGHECKYVCLKKGYFGDLNDLN